ncbi:uncharacterized protein LOC114936427 isoform X5 [Nylanderia fulva]|uniref:uncharacterized protein LOC114936427 isoform X5 n=1 Tax=Nylanderia fulva TaxID=613905 RepID=UPI0010FB201B|nr:uncharacterized protein LOC114936427 isoform X5 [Nylanderia fulva]
MSAAISVELENFLQQMFMECDASILTPNSAISIGDEVSISKIVQYVQDQLPTWSVDDLAEFWKCLAAVSSNNDRVNLWQFKEATKCWITKTQQVQSSQDSNNNEREKLYFTNDTDSSMKDMDINIMEFELRAKLRDLREENILLREELERHEASIDNLRQQCSIAERQLDRYVQKCQQLEKENDEQRDQLNEAIKREKVTALTLQRFTKEQQNLSRQLEAAEIEIQVISPLKSKVEKISKEKMDCMKQIIRLQEKFDDTEDECKQLKVTITELEKMSIKMRETYDQTINNLRERNCQLTEENTELQSLSIFNKDYSSAERLSISSIPDIDGCCTHSTPYKAEKVLLQDSLYTELKASGFVADCSKYDLYIQELDEYDAAILMILEELEKIILIFSKTRSFIEDTSQFSSQDMDARTCNIETLKYKVTFLLNMATKEIARKSTKDSSTQLRADSVNGSSDDLAHFGVTDFRNLLLTRAQPYTKSETDLRSITLCNFSDNKKDDHDDSFSRIIKVYNTSIQNRFCIIEPIVEELYDIINSTHNALKSHRNHSSFENLRYRSVLTLPSQSQQLPSLIDEDSRQQTINCQSLRTDSPDASFAQGDFCLKQENCDEKSTGSHDKENPSPSRSSEMPKVLNVLDSMSLVATSEEEKTSGKIAQEVTSLSNPASPRRKISVYCRSFDVVSDVRIVQDSCEDPRSSLEVRQFSSNPDESSTQVDERLDQKTIGEDQNSAPRYLFNHNYRNTQNDSNSSNDSSPQKQFRDSLLSDESPIEQPVLRKVCLAPTRLKLPQKIKNELNETACVSNEPNSTKLNIANSLLFPIIDNEREKDDDDAVRSSTFIIDKYKTEIKDEVLGSRSCLANENRFRECPTSARRLFSCNHTDSRKVASSENPHSQASVQSVESEPRVERSVDGQMSSREDNSNGEPVAESSSDRYISEKIATSNGLTSAKIVSCKSVTQKDMKTYDRDLSNAKQGKRQQLLIARRSLSSESIGRSRCRCRQEKAPLIPEDQRRVFPSLTDNRLQESGIANLSDTSDSRENMSELELQKRYIVFSLCLCTDRVTLSRRVAISLRQRDQSEKNLSCEVQKMQQDIQDSMRQRNSVSGRMTLRRPSFNSESLKWEVEKLDRTESSNSISELRGIFEQAEFHRSSREENNNMLRVSNSDNQNIMNCAIGNNEIWTSAKEQTSSEFLTAIEDVNLDVKSCIRSSQSFQLRSIPWRMMLWGIIIFFFGFFMNQIMVNACNGPLHRLSIEHILSRYIYKITNAAPHPM